MSYDVRGVLFDLDDTAGLRAVHIADPGPIRDSTDDPYQGVERIAVVTDVRL